MKAHVKLFAILKEKAGTPELILDLPESSTVADLLREMDRLHPGLVGDSARLVVAVNEEYQDHQWTLYEGDEVALIPPVSGGAGAGDERFKITADVLDVQALHELVLAPAAGAISLFVGVVRDNNLGRDVDYLEYEAYPPMAVKKMREIAQELHERWEITDVAMHHRTGRLEIGEASVAIAVASPHRKDGLEACHYAIDRLKQIIPVWKKEVWTDGEHWIEGSLTPRDEASPAPNSVEAD